MIMCSKCKKRPAVVFITSMQGNEKKNEGLCMVCAKESNIPQISDYMEQEKISGEYRVTALYGNENYKRIRNLVGDTSNGFRPEIFRGDDAAKLLEEEKVAVVPGTAFGDCGEGYLRVSYAYSLKNLQKAMERIERFAKRHLAENAQ